MVVAASLCLLLLLSLTLSGAAYLGAIYPGISLRYEAALPAETVKTVSEKEAGGVSFWGQTTAQVRRAAQPEDAPLNNVPVLFYTGNAETVWPGVYRYGQAPPPLSSADCAVSAPLAWQLFGSVEVVGLRILVGQTPYTICGVMAGQNNLLLAPTTRMDGFTAIEITPGANTSANTGAGASPYRDPEAFVRAWLQTAGFAAPSTQLYGNELGAVANFLAWVPLCLAALLVGATAAKASRRWPWHCRNGALFAVLLLLALGLPALLAHIPSWLTPTRWSDFAWWGNLGAVLTARVAQWFAARAYPKDVLAKWCVAKQLALFVLQCILWEVLRCLTTAKPQKEKQKVGV
ncbi:MAG: ABC transporter permease [Gemmiger sp.]|nr:ABC transporter permease [Gemmiger sp.]